MTDTQRLILLLRAIRFVLGLDDSEDDLRTTLIKSVLFEAAKQCRRNRFEEREMVEAL